MGTRYRLTSVETVREDGSWLFSSRTSQRENTEVVLIPCEDEQKPPVEAWINRCTHENQRLVREEIGAVCRDGGIVCPKHGSIFDSCSGRCDNGPAAGSTLRSVEIEIEDGQVYLADDDLQYLHEGPSNDDDDDSEPRSSSHLRF